MFGRYLSRNGIRSVTEVSRKIAEEYLASLKSGAFSSRGKPISDGTYRDHLIALDDFFKWLLAREKLLVNLTLGDFRVESHELLIVNGKGGKDRVVPVGDWACYFTEKALFVQHRNGRRLSPRAVGDIVERATAKSGVGRRVSPHTFRHTMATHMLRNHADLRHIQAILGHTSLRSTQVYTHVNIEDLEEVMRRSHPHGRRTGSVKL